jgi:hypothetical protein
MIDELLHIRLFERVSFESKLATNPEDYGFLIHVHGSFSHVLDSLTIWKNVIKICHHPSQGALSNRVTAISIIAHCVVVSTVMIECLMRGFP